MILAKWEKEIIKKKCDYCDDFILNRDCKHKYNIDICPDLKQDIQIIKSEIKKFGGELLDYNLSYSNTPRYIKKGFESRGIE